MTEPKDKCPGCGASVVGTFPPHTLYECRSWSDGLRSKACISTEVARLRKENATLRAVQDAQSAIISWYEDDHERHERDDSDVPADLLKLEAALEAAKAQAKEKP